MFISGLVTCGCRLGHVEGYTESRGVLDAIRIAAGFSAVAQGTFGAHDPKELIYRNGASSNMGNSLALLRWLTRARRV